jgi:SAM-dependent methyltransferase
MDLSEYRNTEREIARTESLMALAQPGLGLVLDIGARDGHMSLLLTHRSTEVTALDLEKPEIDHPKVRCVRGDVTDLEFPDDYFDLVLCAEVLEHIPPALLSRACSELSRVAKRYVLIGVPYKQDLRAARSTCRTCGGRNPPWGHVNRFDERRLHALFPRCKPLRTEYVGIAPPRTNAVSALLMDLAGNPYGTYTQHEPCIHCGAHLLPPGPRNLPQKVCTRLAVNGMRLQRRFSKPQASWIHLLLAKEGRG